MSVATTTQPQTAHSASASKVQDVVATNDVTDRLAEGRLISGEDYTYPDLAP